MQHIHIPRIRLYKPEVWHRVYNDYRLAWDNHAWSYEVAVVGDDDLLPSRVVLDLGARSRHHNAAVISHFGHFRRNSVTSWRNRSRCGRWCLGRRTPAGHCIVSLPSEKKSPTRSNDRRSYGRRVWAAFNGIRPSRSHYSRILWVAASSQPVPLPYGKKMDTFCHPMLASDRGRLGVSRRLLSQPGRLLRRFPFR